jgi:hypothetical protein
VLAGVLVASLVGLPAYAAGELFVGFRYEVNPGLRDCPGEAEVRGRIEQQLGYAPFRADANDQVTFRIDPADPGKERRQETGILGSVVWTDRTGNGKGERRFSSDVSDCGQLARDMAFAAAVQIQLLATGEAIPPQTSPSPSPAAPMTAPIQQHQDKRAEERATDVVAHAPSATPVETAPSDSLPSPGHWSFLGGVGPSVAWGLAPRTTAAGRGFAAMLSKHAAFEIGCEGTLSTTTRQSDGSGFTARFLLATAAGCFRAGHLLACAAGKLGEIRVHGLGVDRPKSPSSLLVEAGPRLALFLPFADHFFVLGQAAALFAFTRPTVTLNHADAWTVPRFAGVAGIDLGILFP